MRAYQKIGIFAAMQEERDEIVKHLTDLHVIYQKAGLTIEEGSVNQHTVYVVMGGIGKVNSAMATQILIDQLDPDAILNIGVAGALGAGLRQGDIVISSSAQEHDLDCTAVGDPRGVIPRMETSIYPADMTLCDITARVCEQEGYHYSVGKVLSGDQFISSPDAVRELVQLFDGACAEMEGAAMAHVCYLNEKPWLIIRSMSDCADGEAALSYMEFKDIAAARAGVIFKGIIEQL